MHLQVRSRHNRYDWLLGRVEWEADTSVDVIPQSRKIYKWVWAVGTNRATVPSVPQRLIQIIWFTRDVVSSSHVSFKGSHLVKCSKAFRALKFLSKLWVRGLIRHVEVTRPQVWDAGTSIRWDICHGFQSKSSGSVLQGLLDTLLLLLQLCPRWHEIKPIEETLRRFMRQANRGFSHDPMVCVDPVRVGGAQSMPPGHERGSGWSNGDGHHPSRQPHGRGAMQART